MELKRGGLGGEAADAAAASMSSPDVLGGGGEWGDNG